MVKTRKTMATGFNNPTVKWELLIISTLILKVKLTGMVLKM